MAREQSKGSRRVPVLVLSFSLVFLLVLSWILKQNKIVSPIGSIKTKSNVDFSFPSELLSSLPDMFQEKVLGILPNGTKQRQHPSTEDSNKTYIMFPEGIPDIYPKQMLELAWQNATNKIDVIHDNITALVHSSCPVTSQVGLIIKNSSVWILQSLSINGSQKNLGGDEYYVIYTDESHNSPTAVAHSIHDYGNGRYKLQFTESPFIEASVPMRGYGRLEIYLEWSCGLGMLPPGLKNRWYTGGTINAKWNRSGIPAPSVMEKYHNPNPSRLINLQNFDHLVNVGDSTMVQFVSGNYCQGPFRKNLRCLKPVYMPFYMTHVNTSFLNKVNEAIDLLKNQGGKGVAIILGSNTWDLLCDDAKLFGPHMQEFSETATVLIKEIRTLYPNVTIFWKSGSALHPHQLLGHDAASDGIAKPWYYIDRTFYMSDSRARFHYQLEKQLMSTLNVSFLDIFPSTYLLAHFHKPPSDAVHYVKRLNRIMMNWF